MNDDDDEIKTSIKVKHGMFGYIGGHKKLVIIRTAVYFILALGLFFLGIFITHSKKNYLTIIAVLALLPACKSFVNMVMFIRARGCSTEAYEKIKDHTGKLINLYDMFFTTEKENYPVCHLTVTYNTVIGFTEYDKCSCAKCEDHLKDMLSKDGYGNLTIKIFTDITKYTARIDQLEKNDDGSDERSRIENGIASTLLSISLS